MHVPGEARARPLFIERSLPGSIIVNQAARRYMNEALDYHMAGQAMIDNDAPGAGTSPSFVLFDARYKWRYPMGPVLPILPIWILPKAVRQILFQANSWPELARKLDLDPAALQATMERFNANAKEGHDPDFHRGGRGYEKVFGDQKSKGNANLAALETPPFYAFAIYPGDIGTNGGLVTDVNAAVVDVKGEPIPGLYAVGNLAASPMGRSYPGGGATLGAAMTFGYLAGRHATGAN
jgi:3-oxosteroid 1-dehydrogenase